MKWPGKNDDPLDTWLEFFVAWVAIMLTALVIMGVLYWLGGGPCATP